MSPDDGAARLAWQASGAAKVMVMRSPAGARAAQADVVYDGTGAGFTDGNLSNGKRYTYLVQAIDAAGNTASDSASVTPSADASTKHLLSPGAASSLSRPPMLRWRRIARASYYNVQLFRNGKKILSAWPTKPPLPAAPRVAIRRQAPPAGQGHLSVAAVGRIRAPQRAPLRQAAGQAHVHRQLKPGTIPAVRCLYVDLDGTLLGAGGAVTRDGEGKFTLLGVRALEACHRAGALVVAMSGRPRAVLGEDVRLLGMDEYVFEGGAGFVVDGEVHWLTEPDTHERIAASGAPDLLLERYAGRLEPHTPYDRGREVSHALRGLVDVAEAESLLAEHGHGDLRLMDNGEAHHRSPALDGLPQVRLYHLLPGELSKAGGVAAHARARGFAREDCLAVGDSREDLRVAPAVGAFWLVANGLELDPGLRAELARHPNAQLAEADHGAGVYEAVVTTLALR